MVLLFVGTLNRSSEIPQTTEYHFPLPPGYNKFVLPTGKGGSIPPIKVSILIRSVLGVDEKNEVLKSHHYNPIFLSGKEKFS